MQIFPLPGNLEIAVIVQMIGEKSQAKFIGKQPHSMIDQISFGMINCKAL